MAINLLFNVDLLTEDILDILSPYKKSPKSIFVPKVKGEFFKSSRVIS